MLKKHSRVRLTWKQKRVICKLHHEQPELPVRDLCAWAAKEFALSNPPAPVTLRLLLKSPIQDGGGNPTRKTHHKVQCALLEAEVVQWIDSCEQLHIPVVTDATIYDKAAMIRDRIVGDSNSNVTSKLATMVFSDGWLRKLKLRHGIKSRQLHGEAASASPITVTEGRAQLQEITRRYDKCDVFNMDEMAYFYCMPPAHSHSKNLIVGTREDKKRITIAVTSNADGSAKVPLLFISTARQPRCFNGRAGEQLGHQYYSAAKGWMTTSLFQRWVHEFNAAMQKERCSVLLLLDNASCHRVEQPLSNVRIQMLPLNTTAHLQPQDAGVIQLLKARIKAIKTRRVVVKVDELLERAAEVGVENIQAVTVFLQRGCFRGDEMGRKGMEMSDKQDSGKLLAPHGNSRRRLRSPGSRRQEEHAQMHRVSAEDEITYAFASPIARQLQGQQQFQSSHKPKQQSPPYAIDLSASIGSNSNNATTSEDDDNNDGEDSSGGASDGAALQKEKRLVWRTSDDDEDNENDDGCGAGGDERFRHFRKKRVVTETSLRMDVNDLKQEVANLLLLRSILASRVMVRRDDTAGSLVKTTRAFYEYFRDGYTPPSERVKLVMRSASSSSSSKRKRSVSSLGGRYSTSSNSQVDQYAFLQSIMSPVMEAGSIEVSVPLMIEQWRRYTAFFALHDFRMKSFDVVITNQVSIVRTRGEFKLQVTAETITNIFPHLLLVENGDHQNQNHQQQQLLQYQHQWLLDKILGQVLTCACFIDLYFDAQGRIIRYDEAGDFLGAFSSIVHKPSDLVALFDGALLWEAGVIGTLEPIGIDDTSGAFVAPSAPVASSVSAAISGASEDDLRGLQEISRMRKLYEIDFLLNHEFVDAEEEIPRVPEELNLYEYNEDEQTIRTVATSIR